VFIQAKGDQQPEGMAYSFSTNALINIQSQTKHDSLITFSRTVGIHKPMDP